MREVGLAVDVLVERGGLDAEPFGDHPMLSRSKPISSASAAPASVTVAGSRPALGTAVPVRSGRGTAGEGEERVGGLGVRVVPGAVDDGELAEAGGQVGEDAFALGAGVGPVGVEAALDDEDGAA